MGGVTITNFLGIFVASISLYGMTSGKVGIFPGILCLVGAFILCAMPYWRTMFSKDNVWPWDSWRS